MNQSEFPTATRLKAARQFRQISIEQLCKDMGLETSAFEKWEEVEEGGGEGVYGYEIPPSKTIMSEIALYLGFPLPWFFADEMDMIDPDGVSFYGGSQALEDELDEALLEAVKGKFGGQLPKMVAFLQNQWFKDPQKAKEMFDRNPHLREKFIKRFLFAGCPTGKRLRIAFDDLCDSIVWEETSPEIGSQASSNFKPDAAHIHRVLEKHKPDIVLLFGKNARDGVGPLWRGPKVEYPHPTNRKLTESDLGDWFSMLAGEVLK